VSARLPWRSDRGWRRAPRAGSSEEVAYQPMRPPHAPQPSGALDWFKGDGEIVLLQDGYPARLADGVVHVHPMHGRYVLQDLLERYEVDQSEELGEAILGVTRAIVGRAEPHGRALHMWYEGAVASGLIGGRRHISGLPQAYYAALLARVASTLGANVAGDADRFFEPLVTSTSAGGVMYDGSPGPSLAMIPMQPRDWILNGWLSMLVSACHYADARASTAARDLVHANVKTLTEVLPAYDSPEQLLSRYMLPGMLLLRIRFAPRPDALEVRSLRVIIPDEPGAIPIPLHDASGWVPRILPPDAIRRRDGAIVPTAESLRMVALLSRAPFPRPNQLAFEVASEHSVRLSIAAHIGSYDPFRSSTAAREWVELGTVTTAPGSTGVHFSLPYEPINLFSYPTNFARRYHGRPQNTYHATHIVRLRELAEWTENPTLRHWAHLWRSYVERWPTVNAYAGLGCWTPEGSV
jgi:hypothetical protein